MVLKSAIHSPIPMLQAGSGYPRSAVVDLKIFTGESLRTLEARRARRNAMVAGDVVYT